MLLYTDVEDAGVIYNNEISEFTTVPAISSSGTPPFLDNVNVVNNYGDGVKFTDVSNEAVILDCQISRNGQTGLYVSTVGTGKMIIDGVQISDNDGLGVLYGGNKFPEDTSRYKFCGYNMSIGEYMYLDHITNDFIDPYECVQVSKQNQGAKFKEGNNRRVKLVTYNQGKDFAYCGLIYVHATPFKVTHGRK